MEEIDLVKEFESTAKIALSTQGCFFGSSIQVSYPTVDEELNGKLKSLITAFAENNLSGDVTDSRISEAYSVSLNNKLVHMTFQFEPVPVEIKKLKNLILEAKKLPSPQ
jgi:hypothetical protein